MPENEIVDLEVLAEKVRERLNHHGQHGALADFAKYTAEVERRLSSKGVTVEELAAIKADVFSAGGPGLVTEKPTDSAPTSAQSKPAPKARKAKAVK